MARTKRFLSRNVALLVLVGLGAVLIVNDAVGKGVMPVMTQKTLPEATISLLDPEGGDTSGAQSSDVNLAEGDIILFRFEFVSAPNAHITGINHYLTEYLPPNVEVVGTRFVKPVDHDNNPATDVEYWTVEPNYPGISMDGPASGTVTSQLSNVPCDNSVTGCSGNTRDLYVGSIAAQAADTGVFFFDNQSSPYTGDSAGMDRIPSDDFITLFDTGNNPVAPLYGGDNTNKALIGLASGDSIYMHNVWDELQVIAYGLSSSDGVRSNSGGGEGPYLYGSPVAGPDTFYLYEASSDGGSGVEFNDVIGPWQRIRVPGAVIGVGTGGFCDTTTGTSCDVDGDCPGSETCILNGTLKLPGRPYDVASTYAEDVTPNNPVTSSALRYAFGKSQVGAPTYAEVALRVVSPFADTGFLDPAFQGSGGNIDCSEVFGSEGTSSGVGTNAAEGDDNTWTFYAGSPSCVYLKYFVDLEVDQVVVPASNTVLDYSLRVKNLSLSTEQNVYAHVRGYEGLDVGSISGGGTSLGDCSTGGAGIWPSQACIEWDIGTLAPGEERTFTFSGSSGGASSNMVVVTSRYTSDSILTGYTNQTNTVKRLVNVPGISGFTWNDPGAGFQSAGDTAVNITGNITNDGGEDLPLDSIRLFLPTGWSVTGNSLDVGAATWTCSPCGDTPRFSPGAGVDVPLGGGSVAVDFDLTIPGGAATDLYTLDFQFWGSNTGEVNSDSLFPNVASIPVGQARTAPPDLDCDLQTSATTAITGQSAQDATVKLYFSRIERGSNASAGTKDADGQTPATAKFSVPKSEWDNGGSTFGELYGGLEVRATAQVSGEFESELSDPCFASRSFACSDGVDNDGDNGEVGGGTDFPADLGCTSPQDNSEDPFGTGTNNEVYPECSNQIDDADTDTDIDWPADLQCYGPDDPSEADTDHQCEDGEDNDYDGYTDCDPAGGGNLGPDPDCACVNGSPTGNGERSYPECMDGIDNDGDGDGVDFPDDPGCHSPFDDSEDTVLNDPEKGRILFVFDTSGSMNWSTCEDKFTGGDGSLTITESNDVCAGDDVTNCGEPDNGNGRPDDSRIYKVKEGISDVVASFGDVEYALMRFKQIGQDFKCPGSNASLGSGSWQGGGIEPCTPFDEGELLVSFAPDNAKTMLKFMDGSSNYDPNDVTAQAPYGLDWELRGTGTTPLGGSLDSALTYLSVVQASDTLLDPFDAICRPYNVILVTDGLETCDTATYCTVGGGSCGDDGDCDTGDTNDVCRSAPEIAAKALYDAGIGVTVIGFASTDNAIETALTAIAQAGSGGILDGTSGKDAVFVTDQATLSDEIVNIVEASILVEFCDGSDNDCDGQTDEGFPVGETCNNGELGECLETGTYECDLSTDITVDGFDFFCNAAAGTPRCPGDACCDSIENECCDLVPRDDDCDGLIDENVTCNCGSDEICNGIDDTCDGEVDEDINGEGEDCGYFGYTNDDLAATVCRTGTLVCNGTNPMDCEGVVTPGTEVCDGAKLDEDCDLEVDEDIFITCFDDPDGVGTGVFCEQPGDCCENNGGVWTCVGVCRTGTKGCDAGTGLPEATCGGAYVGPSTETCNNRDDDCDSLTDEDFVLGSGLCDNGEDGICFRTGNLICDPNNPTQTLCTAPTIGTGAPEVCDGLDNDCDGEIDEEWTDPLPDDLLPTCAQTKAFCEGAPADPLCDTGGALQDYATWDCADWLGAPINLDCGNQSCGGGTFQCIAVNCDTEDPPNCDKIVSCEGSSGGQTEVCDGIDNDCDNKVDETFAGQFQQCIPPEFDPVPGVTGECDYGEILCVPQGDGTSEEECTGYQGPEPEVCDGLDNDCDGTADDMATCPAPEDTCVEGTCVSPCIDSEFPCSFGFYCDRSGGPSDGFCLADPCADITCESGFFCESGTGVCIDLCADVQCRDGEICQNGFCLDCFVLGCQDDELCKADEFGVGVCETDACFGVECGDTEFCRDGQCVGLTCDPDCDDSQRCEDGVCVTDLCDGVRCNGTLVCDTTTGECVNDRCMSTSCLQGEVCNPGDGTCISDPCVGIICPAGTSCGVTFEGKSACFEPKGELVFAGGSGCSIGADAGKSSNAWWLAALAVLALRRRRRRQ